MRTNFNSLSVMLLAFATAVQGIRVHLEAGPDHAVNVEYAQTEVVVTDPMPERVVSMLAETELRAVMENAIGAMPDEILLAEIHRRWSLKDAINKIVSRDPTQPTGDE